VAEIDKKCYLLPDEDPEYRTCKHKSHVDKVMFGVLLQGQVGIHTQGNGGMARSTSCHSSNMSGRREALATAQPAR
jgi:hypothetical protein